MALEFDLDIRLNDPILMNLKEAKECKFSIKYEWIFSALNGFLSPFSFTDAKNYNQVFDSASGLLRKSNAKWSCLSVDFYELVALQKNQIYRIEKVGVIFSKKCVKFPP